MKTTTSRHGRKAIALLAAAVLGIAHLHAQDSPNGVRLGLKLSPNMGFLRSDTKELKADGAGLGYTFGLLTEFPFGSNGNYRFATGLFLNRSTAKWSQAFEYFDALGQTTKKTKDLETTAKLQYIELPLTMKLMTNEIGYMRYFGQVGFGTAFNIRARADNVVPAYYANSNGTIVEKFEEQKNEDIMSDVNLFKASLIVGAGAEYNFSGSTSLLFGITYNNGFTNILNFDIGDKKAKALMNYLELNLGLYF